MLRRLERRVLRKTLQAIVKDKRLYSVATALRGPDIQVKTLKEITKYLLMDILFDPDHANEYIDAITFNKIIKVLNEITEVMEKHNYSIDVAQALRHYLGHFMDAIDTLKILYIIDEDHFLKIRQIVFTIYAWVEYLELDVNYRLNLFLLNLELLNQYNIPDGE